ncbi:MULTISPECIES: helix-turn-helix domain-containing protein [unclassified Curtobacterium]|uniref:winged helix-turn-helix transcriptional regulator n=1 Tax=unclassified Curtobacterium TaxID=257496 RepID=UPI001C64B135|nr:MULTISPECIES: helix-turn-helix domain-containing protein [unclassified Curtobacterium]
MVTESTTVGQRSQRGDLFSKDCPTRVLLDRIGGKWVSMVIALLAENDFAEMGFAQLNRGMPGVSHKMLSVTLQGLVRDGLVDRRVEDSVPPRVYYQLTPLGMSLSRPLEVLREWAEEHVEHVDSLNRLQSH